MADVGVVYTLNTSGTDITFNATTVPFNHLNQYYITEIRGLESPTLRTPHDPVPLGDGALIHPFYYGERVIEVEGIFLVQSTTIENAIVVIRNTMTNNLSAALNDCKTTAATFSFTPQGAAARSISVNYYTPLQVTHANNYHDLLFSFGLIAGVSST